MLLAGELLSFVVSWAQEISIVAGVGAATIMLVGHLLGLHSHVPETARGYMRAARHIRALSLTLILISGILAVLVHFQTQTLGVLLAPAFVFKWLLIGLLVALYFIEWDVAGLKQDAVEGFEGASWYALLIVHTLAPVVGWSKLWSLYAGWLVTFGVIWIGFVWYMRSASTIGNVPKQAPKPVQPAPAPPPMPPPPPKPVPAPPKPKPAPPPAPKPAAAPAPVVQKTIEVHPNHSLLPMVAELDLPAPKPAPVPVPTPAPAPVVKPGAPLQGQTQKPEMTDLDYEHLPALYTMPKRPEDVGSSKRGPVVKMEKE